MFILELDVHGKLSDDSDGQFAKVIEHGTDGLAVEQYAYFGASVTAIGDPNSGPLRLRLAIGAPGAQSGAGVAFILDLDSSGLIQSQMQLSPPSDVYGLSYGASVADVGDINNDGFADLAFSKKWSEGEINDTIHILHGSKSFADITGVDGTHYVYGGDDISDSVQILLGSESSLDGTNHIFA